jgi:hypothetical protein
MAIKQTSKVIRGATLGNPLSNVPPKTIAAVILVVVMGVLWIRVLFRSGTDTAMADSMTAGTDSAMQQADTGTAIQIRLVSLTEIPGRHDTIADDVFRADRCSVWSQKTETAAPTTQAVDNQRMADELIKAVMLEAIIKDAQGNAEKACINGSLVSAGSVLQVSVRNEMQSVRVMTIEAGRVQLNWQDRSIDIEMPDQKVK